MKAWLIVFFLGAFNAAHAEVAVNVTFQPLPPEFKPLEPAIRAHVIAAAKEWMSHFKTVDCTLEVSFNLKPWPARGTGRSFTNTPLKGEMAEGKQITEEGAPHKIRTGFDANGDAPDIEMFFDPEYFRSLWFDPRPDKRTAPVPVATQQKLDAFSVFLHELGHAFGFNGFRDQKTGVPSGPILSTYDRWVSFDGKDFFFKGPNAMKAYRGKPVPLAHTNNNYHHVAEAGSVRDRKLTEDLMNGITLNWGQRYYVTPLDIAMLSDCGLVPIK